MIPIPPLCIKFSISSHFKTKKIRPQLYSGDFGKKFCLKMGWNWKFDVQRGYMNQHLFYKKYLILKFLLYYCVITFVTHCTGSTALDFMDPRFIIYMTSAFQRYVTLLLCFGDFFRVRSFPIMLWLRPFWLGLNELAAVTKEPTFWLWIVMAHLGQKLKTF